MDGLLKMVGEKVLNSTTLFGVLILDSGCMGEISGISLELHLKLKKLQPNFDLILVCLDPDDMPFPRPLVNVLYYFAPGNPKPLFYTKDNDIYEQFEGHYQYALEISSRVDEVFMNNLNDPIIEHTEQMFDDEETQELPPTSKMLRSFAKDMWKSAKSAGKGLPVLVPAEVATERYTICEGCPNLTEEFRCTECGCFMKKKTHLAQSKCPLGKWTEFNKE